MKEKFLHHSNKLFYVRFNREKQFTVNLKNSISWIILWSSRNRYKRPCTRYIILNPKDLIQTSCSANEVNLDHSRTKGFDVDDLNRGTVAYIIPRSKVDSFKYFETGWVSYLTCLPYPPTLFVFLRCKCLHTVWFRVNCTCVRSCHVLSVPIPLNQSCSIPLYSIFDLKLPVFATFDRLIIRTRRSIYLIVFLNQIYLCIVQLKITWTFYLFILIYFIKFY